VMDGIYTYESNDNFNNYSGVRVYIKRKVYLTVGDTIPKV